MRKICCWLLAVCTVFALSCCGEKTSESNSAQGVKNKTEPLTDSEVASILGDTDYRAYYKVLAHSPDSEGVVFEDFELESEGKKIPVLFNPNLSISYIYRQNNTFPPEGVESISFMGKEYPVGEIYRTLYRMPNAELEQINRCKSATGYRSQLDSLTTIWLCDQTDTLLELRRDPEVNTSAIVTEMTEEQAAENVLAWLKEAYSPEFTKQLEFEDSVSQYNKSTDTTTFTVRYKLMWCGMKFSTMIVDFRNDGVVTRVYCEDIVFYDLITQVVTEERLQKAKSYVPYILENINTNSDELKLINESIALDWDGTPQYFAMYRKGREDTVRVHITIV